VSVLLEPGHRFDRRPMRPLLALKPQAGWCILRVQRCRVWSEGAVNDTEIRQSFHRKKLKRHHEDQGALVIDELGLKHGACRADIAVINGRLLGFEIKSDRDVLSRLSSQVSAYDAVFDHTTIVVGERHLAAVNELVPAWWGIVLCVKGKRGGIHFLTQRKPSRNRRVDPLSIAQLLWRPEAVEVLRSRGEEERTLRKPRQVLYARLVETMSSAELKQTVSSRLRSREDWRCPQPPSQCGGSSQPDAKS